MKRKTSELTGSRLARAVAIAAGYAVEREDGGRAWIVRLPREATPDACPVASFSKYGWRPDLYWAQAGPLIDRFDVQLGGYPGARSAEIRRDDSKLWREFWGETYMQAAMRAIVYWELGEEVELP